MTKTTKEVFEKYQVRKNKKQKSAFIDYVRGVAEGEGYACKVERGALGARNIVVGNPDTAKVVYTAHYDTCPVLPMPNFITPKCFLLYLLYQLLLVGVVMILPMVLTLGLLTVGLGVISVLVPIPTDVFYVCTMAVMYGVLILVMFLIMAGPANRRTANDNTSGVTTLLDIMTDLPQNLRADAAFIFFDFEELGLVGSMSYAKSHRSEMKDKLLVNFDCVSDGGNFIFALRPGALRYKKAIEAAFASEGEFSVEVLSKGVFYPSDQACFPCGVGVAALKRSRRLGILYMNRIHTTRDTVYEEENIAYLVRGARHLTSALAGKEGNL